MMRFQNPYLLLLLLVIPVIIYRYIKSEKGGTIRFSDIGSIKSIRPSLKLRHSLIVLRSLGLALLIVAFARPQSGTEEREMLTEGIDIILTLDASGSMQSKDLDSNKKSRLDVSKEVVSEFVNGRTNDRLGLVVFAGRSATWCPLTLDYGTFLNFLDSVSIEQLQDIVMSDSTAIGTAIANSVAQLGESEAKSKVIILLTDGSNNKVDRIPNTGIVMDPITAARIAASLGIRIYTIGAGSKGTIMREVEGIFGVRFLPYRVEIDEETLQKIADITGGKYYRATSQEKLSEIYEEISQLEKTEIKTKEHVEYTEIFSKFALAGLFMLLLEIFLANTRFRKIP